MQARVGRLPPKADYGNDTSIFEFTRLFVIEQLSTRWNFRAMFHLPYATTHPSGHMPMLSPHTLPAICPCCHYTPFRPYARVVTTHPSGHMPMLSLHTLPVICPCCHYTPFRPYAHVVTTHPSGHMPMLSLHTLPAMCPCCHYTPFRPCAHVVTTHPSSHVPVLSPHAFQDEVFSMRHHLFIPISEYFL